MVIFLFFSLFSAHFVFAIVPYIMHIGELEFEPKWPHGTFRLLLGFFSEL